MLGRIESLGTGNAEREPMSHAGCDTAPGDNEITARRFLHSNCNSVPNYLNLSLHLVVGRAQEMAQACTHPISRDKSRESSADRGPERDWL